MTSSSNLGVPNPVQPSDLFERRTRYGPPRYDPPSYGLPRYGQSRYGLPPYGQTRSEPQRDGPDIGQGSE